MFGEAARELGRVQAHSGEPEVAPDAGGDHIGDTFRSADP